jgi:hypothetical protein
MEEQAPYGAIISPALVIQEERATLIDSNGRAERREAVYVRLNVTFKDSMLGALKGAKLAVFLCIALHSNSAGESWPSIATIAEKTCYTETVVRESLRELEGMGLIVSEVRFRDSGGQTSNHYQIAAFVNSPLPPRGSESDTPPLVKSDTPPGVTFSTPKYIHKEEDTEEVSPLADASKGTRRLPRVSPLFPADALSGEPTVSVNEYRQVEEKSQQVKAKKEACAVKVKGGSAEKPKREMTATPAQVRELVAYFCHKTGKAAPDLRATGAYGKMKVLWEYKVDDYFALMGNDMSRAKDAIDFAVSKLPPDMIVSPKSLENIIMANRERIPRGNMATVIEGRAVSMPG